MEIEITQILLPHSDSTALIQKYSDTNNSIPIFIITSSKENNEYRELIDICDYLVVFWNGVCEMIACAIEWAKSQGKEIKVIYSYPITEKSLTQAIS